MPGAPFFGGIVVGTIRIPLLLLLALMLAVRGAVAAAMLCTPGQGGMPAAHHHATAEQPLAAPAALHGHGDAAAGHDDASGQAPAHHAAASVVSSAAPSAGPHADDGAGTDHDCGLCAGFCSFATLVPAHPALPAAQAAPVTYPALAVPALEFLLDGQERPPRTI